MLTGFPEFAEWIGIEKSHECFFKKNLSSAVTTGKPGLLEHADGAEIECRLFVGFRLSSLLVSQPLLVPGDLTDEETVKRTVEQTLAHYGRLDVLVNSAGILAMGGIETPDLAQYDRVMNINVRWDFCPTTEQQTTTKYEAKKDVLSRTVGI